MTPLVAPVIDGAAQLPPEEAFEGLFEAALARVQALSGATWTDYNEHDPGVTMLEALCYALTDIGYRTNHPIADIIASSAATHGLTPAQMALYTGAEILPTAPVTEEDVRDLLRVNFPSLSGVTLAPRRQNAQVVDVFLHVSRVGASGPGGGLAEAAARLLRANRPMGLAWGDVTEIAAQPYALQAQIELAPEAAPVEAAARILRAAAEASAPPPAFAGPVEEALDAPSPPLVGLFDLGGARRAAPAQPADPEQEPGQLRRAISALPEVRGIARLSTGTSGASALRLAAPAVPGAAEKVTAQPIAPLRVPALDSEALAQLDLTRMGVALPLDAAAVRARYAELEAAQQDVAAYDLTVQRAAGQGRVPLGNPRRELGRYRSVQFLFPQIYGLGRLGLTSPLRGDQRAERMARILQLKGFLLFFEQIMANTLAQLDGLAPLLSSAPLTRSYFAGPLAGEGAARQEVAPQTARLLGEGSGAGWAVAYRRKLEAALGQADPVGPRLNRALDHMLARFGQRVPDRHRRTLDESAGCTPSEAWGRVLEDKRALLAEAVPLGRNRGLGVNPDAPDGDFAFLRALRLRTGFRGAACVIEHAELAPVEPQKVQAVALETETGLSLTGLLAQPHERFDWPELGEYLATACGERAAWQIWPQEDYSAVLVLRPAKGPGLTIYQRFRCIEEAREARALLLAVPPRLLPTLFPGRFFGARLTCLLARHDTSAEMRAFVGREVLAQCPAHLQTALGWAERFDLSFAAREYAAQLAAPKVRRARLVALVQQVWVARALEQVQAPGQAEAVA
ncbi:hypothetical protein [Vannielia litorea]|uniref:hypothetical protein n=1 Tax=Vannielia litorea TaxID=1217970 RepID=UPI001BD138B3|nr:hypothetical protein [Vannielia litorea]MBS8226339.1 hypothetical protein [Vannielia litorea]